MKKSWLATVVTFYLFANPCYAQISGWITTLIASQTGVDLGHDPSMVVDNEGFIHVLHTVPSTPSLRYTTNRTQNGIFETKPLAFSLVNPILQALPRSEADLAIRGKQLVVCYYQAANHRLEYIEKDIDAIAFSNPLLLDASSADIGENCSIAVDGSAGVHISYWDDSNKKIRCLFRSTNPAQNQGPFTLTPSAATAHVGPWNSLAVYPDGTAHVAYYYDQLVPPAGNPLINQMLLYSSKVLSSNSFPESVIAIQGTSGNADPDFGKFSSAAADSKNKLHVCYFENNNGDLKLRYATNETIADTQSNWPSVVLTEDPPTPEGRHCSIFFEAGRIHVAYVEQASATSQRILYRSKAPLELLSEPQSVTSGNIADIDLFVQRTMGKAYITYLMPFPNLSFLRYARAVLCGDQACEDQETCASCATDCGVCPPTPPQCGNGICEVGEPCDGGCTEDCGLCEEPAGPPQPGGATTPGGGTAPPGGGGGGGGAGEPTGGGCQLILKR